jgi:hypothetical protein
MGMALEADCQSHTPSFSHRLGSLHPLRVLERSLSQLLLLALQQHPAILNFVVAV